jgi:hypothetical protein
MKRPIDQTVNKNRIAFSCCMMLKLGKHGGDIVNYHKFTTSLLGELDSFHIM